MLLVGILKGTTNLRNKVFHIDLLYNPVILLKGVYLREIKLMFTQNLYMKVNASANYDGQNVETNLLFKWKMLNNIGLTIQRNVI